MNTTKQNFFGIINVNKPKGFTSHDVVAKLRKILNIKQIGHTGTLDPMATGVLPVCIGKATKIIQYLESSKAYRAFIKLGIKTDTYDMEGQILEKIPVNINMDEIKKYLKDFKGEITQTPPIYSAVHYKGKRLYEYARKNIEITDIPTRKVTINSIELLDILSPPPPHASVIARSEATKQSMNSCFLDCRVGAKVPPRNDENPVLIVDIDCSEGTYIRSIAYDLGEKLGCGACLSDLIRTKAGRFTLDKTHTLEEIESYYQSRDFDKFLLNPVEILPLEVLEVDEVLLEKIQKGQCFTIDQNFLCHSEVNSKNLPDKQQKSLSPNEQILRYAQDDRKSLLQLVYKNKLAAIARFEDNVIKPVNVFI